MATKEYKTNLLLISCSGASNTGCYADRAARELDMGLEAEMVCFAKLAIKDEKLINKLKTTNKKIIVIDGCPLNCAQKTVEALGIQYHRHINMTDMGITKGQTPLTQEKLNEVVEYIKSLSKETAPQD